MRREGHASLAELTSHRIRELEAAGRRSLTGDSVDRLRLGTMTKNKQEPAQFFREARQEAKQWHDARRGFMTEQLAVGRHPDTHADFWDEFDYSKTVPQPPKHWSMETKVRVATTVAISIVVTVLLLAIWLFRKWIRKRRARVAVQVST